MGARVREIRESGTLGTLGQGAPDNTEIEQRKTIELVANAIQNSSEEGDLILDAFGGSGTTLLASEQTGRKAYLMEYDEHYCDVIIARWEKFTGKQATKIN